jgi:NHLM bacteriocin system ABC transporter ATP-binding protein
MRSSSARSEARPPAGGGPLRLDGGAAAWTVVEGAIEVFAVPRGEAGPRLHLGTVSTGGALFAVEPDGGRHGLGLIAVGQAGCRVQRLPGLGGPGGIVGQGDTAAGLEGWLGALFLALRPGPPPAGGELRAGELRLAPGQAARARDGISWVSVLEGRCHLLGREGLALEAGDLLPLPAGAWVTGDGVARLLGRPSGGLTGGELRRGLARAHALVLAGVAHQAAHEEARERSRVERKAELDESSLRSASLHLTSVLDPAPPGSGPAVAPLVEACRVVGGAQGFAVSVPPGLGEGARHEDPLARICAASRLRSRPVLLHDDWWRRDNGPLLGFLTPPPGEVKGHPVALIPSSPRRYDLVDPVRQTRVPVDAAVAATLAEGAYVLYPPLPERPVTTGDLLRLALRGGRRELATVLLAGLGGGLLSLLVPLLTGRLFGEVLPGGDRGRLAQIALALLAGALASAGFQLARSIAVLRASGRMEGSLQAAVWDRVLALPVSLVRRFTVADLADRAMGIDAIRDLLMGNVLTTVLAAVFSLFSLGLLFAYSWSLALLAVGLAAIPVLLSAGLVAFQVRHQRTVLRLQGKIADLVFSFIQAVGKLRVGGAETQAYAQWAVRFAEQRRHSFAAQRLAVIQESVNASCLVLASVAVFSVVGGASRPVLTLGGFLAFNAAYGQFLTALLALTSILSRVLLAVPVYERLRPVLAAAPEVDASKAEPGELAGEIELSHVTFRYQSDGPLILDDVSLRVRPGELVALVGASGAGKSTCLRLILGFEKPSSGSIYFDGQDLASLAVSSVRRQFGVVLQNSQPLSGSILTNIVGSLSLGIDDAWEAARKAGLEDDIRSMPMGLHTIVSEGGETFSGGQRQRLLIARAIVHRPRILLFDEATSALDNRTQEMVIASLRGLEATRLVIAHRLSTIAAADRIYVLAAGRIVEEGTYAGLMARGGPFARLVERQVS